MPILSKQFAEATQPFVTVYTKVTNNLRLYITQAISDNDIQEPEGDWLEWLVRAFWRSYQKWETTRDLEAYFDRFHRWPSPNALRLMAHAYLHIAYDLPRDIANSLIYAGPRQSPVAQPTNPPTVDLNRARKIYLRQTSLFARLTVEFSRTWGTAGALCLFGWILPRSFFDVLSTWVPALRNDAWIHGEMLKDADPSTRVRMETQLLEAVKQAASEVMGPHWNPFTWPRRFQAPVLFAGIVLLQSTSWAQQHPAWAAAFLLIVFLCLYLAAVSSLAAHAEALAERIHEYTWQAVNLRFKPSNDLNPEGDSGSRG